MVTRRDFLKYSATVAGAAALPRPVLRWRPFNQTPPPPLDAATITKYAMPLVVPPAMPKSPGGPAGRDFYRIAVRQFNQQILPTGSPVTPVWGYGSLDDETTFNYPAFTIEAQVNRPVTVQWVNGLVDSQNRYLPHLLPVDPTLHWANPPGPRDTRPTFTSTPSAYPGPVPIVSHVHGATTTEDSDGYPEAWYLPAAANIPANYFRVGSFYEEFAAKSLARYGTAWAPGSAIFNYPNNMQPAGTIWYHDHTLGMTRLNVYAGLAGFYLLRGGAGDLPAGVLPGGEFELPLAIQDRSFYETGALRYPVSRTEFDEFAGPYIPTTHISPIWNPEFFGDTMVVNGRTWPVHAVQPRRYRLRLLNGCDSRFLILKLVARADAEVRPVAAALPIWQVGSDSGFLAEPVEQESILLGPGERADVVVDFTGLAGQKFVLINEGPDEPFGGGVPGVDFPFSIPTTTGQVMGFDISVPMSGADTTTPPAGLNLPAVPSFQPRGVRQVSLNEVEQEINEEAHVQEALLGTVMMDGQMPMGMPMMWADDPTETPRAGIAEEWQIFNFTMDAHPIHLHETQFRVVGRRSLMGGAETGPEPGEVGLKDTVIAYPDAVTRLHVLFRTPGRFVWHCHILSHEDNEMMRPMQVLPYALHAPVILKNSSPAD